MSGSPMDHDSHSSVHSQISGSTPNLSPLSLNLSLKVTSQETIHDSGSDRIAKITSDSVLTSLKLPIDQVAIKSA